MSEWPTMSRTTCGGTPRSSRSVTHVSEVMQACIAETGLLADRAPAPAQVVRLDRGSPAGREDEPVLVPVRPGFRPLGELRFLCSRSASAQNEGSGTVRAESWVSAGRTEGFRRRAG